MKNFYMDKMEQKLLVGKIIKFCFDYEAVNETVTESELRNLLETRLEAADFIETLINTIIIKTKTCASIDIELVKVLLLELEKIRLDIEYKNYVA